MVQVKIFKQVTEKEINEFFRIGITVHSLQYDQGNVLLVYTKSVNKENKNGENKKSKKS